MSQSLAVSGFAFIAHSSSRRLLQRHAMQTKPRWTV
jgi:hypothetical protein